MHNLNRIDFTDGSGTDTCKVFLIRDSGTVYGLLSFDYELEAIEASERYGPYEIHWRGTEA